jgi:hypothetical protein
MDIFENLFVGYILNVDLIAIGYAVEIIGLYKVSYL